MMLSHHTRPAPLSLRLLHLLLVSLPLLLLPFASSDPVSEKTVNVAMSATWSVPSLLVETSEHLATVDPAHYFSFLDLLPSHTSTLSHPVTDLASHTLALSLASSLLGPASLEVLTATLALHTHSVKAHLYHTLLNDTRLTYPPITPPPTPSSCPYLVQYAGRLACDVSAVDPSRASDEAVYDFDHVFPSTAPANRTVILWADLTSLHSHSAHSHLTTLARDGLVRYVFRPRVEVRAGATPLQLQGWGMELAIKNMEYKVLDDVVGHSSTAEAGDPKASSTLWSRLAISDPEVIASLAAFQAEYFVNAEEEKIFQKDNADYQLSQLALQATQVLLHSTDPLLALSELTGNFPAYASALTKVDVNDTVMRGVNRKDLAPGANLISLHGQALSLDDLDVYALLGMLQSHGHLIDYFAALHLSPASTRQLLSATHAAAGDPQEAMLAMYGGGVDPNSFLIAMDTHLPAVSSLLLWLNDIEKDKRYNQWPSSVREFLSPSWGQQLKYVRQNLYTGVIVADLTTKAGLELLHLSLFYVKANAPIRLALLPYIPQDAVVKAEWDDSIVDRAEYSPWLQSQHTQSTTQDSMQVKLAKLLHYVDAEKGREDMLDYAELLFQEGLEVMTEDIALDLLYQIAPELEKKGAVAAVYADPVRGQFVRDLGAYITARGLDEDVAPALVVHGAVYRYTQELAKDFRSYLMEIIYAEQRKAGLRAYIGVFKDRMDFAEYWNSRSNVYPKVSPHILRPAEAQKFVKALLPAKPPSDAAPKLVYLTSVDDEREFLVKGVTYWVVADWDTVEGLLLARAALQHVETVYKEYQSRVAFIHNPSSPATATTAYTARLASAIVHSLTTSKALTQLKRLAVIASNVLSTNPSALLPALQHFVSSTPQLSKLTTVLTSDPASLNKGAGLNPAVSPAYLRDQLQVPAGETAVIANGYIVRPPTNSSLSSLVADFHVLDDFVHQTLKAATVRTLVESFAFPGLDSDDITSEWYSDIVQQATFALSTKAVKTPSRASAVQWPSVLDATEDEAVIVHSSPSAWMEMKVLLNPLSKEGQQLSGVLLALRQSFNITIQIFLNPARQVEQLPLKRFYHYAVDLQLHFDGAGALIPFQGAFFRHLQTRAVLTLTVDTPEPWLVMLKVAPYDLDNLRLDTAASHLLYIEYALEHLLISGQCFDHTTKPPAPPAGLQLQLSSPSLPYAGDTVVMQNLGYFQLKANPGVWSLQFPDRHSSIYQLHPTLNEGYALSSNLSTTQLSVVSLTDSYKRLAVQRRPGQEAAQLLEVTRDRKTGLFQSIFHPSEAAASEREAATIHIFSLASGHLYERFLKIMMLSVIQHTQSPVKFWFIRNFASPQFVAFVPQMAAHYNFSVEFVTYRWPVWLRRQTEKQRVIWGYKILFLDVLWPLRIPRVIYIDADQVVRGDVKELWDMDLQQHPYAYVPFCDSNEETKGFRFWDSGYWKDHLRGKPYHISALYVVDLQIFRALRAGDSLRSIYDNLSADPASLANLDQDLPNYAQHMVPILSLPQQWLWCQTWCSMEELPLAKTIDLCNNPLTKTPKLEVAKQLLPEWVGLDQEARGLEEKIKGGEAGTGVQAGEGGNGKGQGKGEEYVHEAKPAQAEKGTVDKSTSGKMKRHDEL